MFLLALPKLYDIVPHVQENLTLAVMLHCCKVTRDGERKFVTWRTFFETRLRHRLLGRRRTSQADRRWGVGSDGGGGDLGVSVGGGGAARWEDSSALFIYLVWGGKFTRQILCYEARVGTRGSDSTLSSASTVSDWENSLSIKSFIASPDVIQNI